MLLGLGLHRHLVRVIAEVGDANCFAGIAVPVKGGRGSAMSDDKGEFSIRPSSRVAGLIISSINYETQELSLMAGTDTLVQMQARVIALSDVTVLHTGYQQQNN